MPKLLVAGLLGVLAFLLWRNWSRRRRAAYIDAFPYPRLLDQRLAARRPELTAAQRRAVFVALADYFQLCRTAGRRLVAMPSRAADEAWHEFILLTRPYDKFCHGAFGRFLHHTPASGMPSPAQADEGIRRAWRLACRRERINPAQPERLPRLFALDAELGMDGGFTYALAAMAQMPGNRGGSGDGGSGDSWDGDGGCSGDGGGDGGGCGGD